MGRNARKVTFMVAGVVVAGVAAVWLYRAPVPPDEELAATHESVRPTPPKRPAPIPQSADTPSDADLLPEIPLPDDWEKDPVVAASERQIAARMKELEERVSRETTAEKVHNLLYELTSLIGDPLMEGPNRIGVEYIATLHDDFRVQALADVAENGTNAERRRLYRLLVEMCQICLEDLPLIHEEGRDKWMPSATDLGGGIALPYLLIYVDEDAVVLPLVAKMYLRLQEGGRIQAPPGFPDDAWFGCKEGLVFAYTCDHFLNVYATRPDLRAGLSGEQRKVISEYVEHRDNRPEDWNIERQQRKVMKFAVRFADLEDES